VTTIYLAGPLFGLAEQEFNQRLTEALVGERSGLVVILPQDRAKDLLPKENGVELVFRDCLDTIDRSDAVLAILDGADADSGTCIELGYAYARGKPIVGVRTDFRASEDRGLNLMVSHICAHLLTGPVSDTRTLARRILPIIDHVLLRGAQASYS
jgi:nucleoside 2-deoxyribosyltransferase